MPGNPPVNLPEKLPDNLPGKMPGKSRAICPWAEAKARRPWDNLPQNPPGEVPVG